MPAALVGRKVGMTRYFMEDGRNIPVTVIEAGPCSVTQIKTAATDGYSAVQIGFEDVKPRRSTIPVIGHDHKAGVSVKRTHHEIRLPDDAAAGAYQPGQTLDVSLFENIKFVDVVGTSKGKGFAGVMKRYHFAGQEASHGTERKHRSVGSIASHATNRGWGPKPKSGKRMPGHMGHERVTVRSLDVIAINPEKNLILVKGPIPGPNRGLVIVREATRLYRSKANLVKGKGKKGK